MDQDIRGVRICICSPDYLYMIKNGGIGTSFAHSVSVLGKRGAAVTVLYANAIDGLSLEDCERAKARVAQDGAALHFLFDHDIAATCEQFFPGDIFTVTSYLAYRWLKTRDFDIVIFPDWRGVGFFSVNAKRQGLAFARTELWVQAHSTSLWHELNNQATGFNEVSVRCFLYERKQVELCDRLIGASRYLLDWKREHGFRLPTDTRMLPLLIDTALLHQESASRPAGERVTVDEIVFFGRLEKRKGLQVYLQALQRLARLHPDLVARVKFTFLGKIAVIDGTDSAEYIDRALGGLPLQVVIIPSLSSEEAITYLTGRAALAVMPSLTDNSPLTVHECIYAAIPFLASDTGGIPEIVAPADHADVLCAPMVPALATRLADILQRGQRLARPAFDQVRDVVPLWLDLLSQHRQAAGPAASTEGQPQPLVTVCVTHYERPRLLKKTFDGLAAQTYGNLEVIVVDNGSADPEAADLLANLATLYPALAPTVHHLPDLYAGAARNHGIGLARGEYIIFMDDDNYAHPRQIETYVRAALASGYDALTCAAIAFPEDEDPADLKSFTALYLPAGCGISLNLFGNSYGDANAIFRASALRAVKGFTEERLSWEDYEVFSALEQAGFKVASVPEPLMYLRNSVGSVSRRGSMLGNYYRALRPALKSFPWDTYGDALLVALSGSLETYSRINFDGAAEADHREIVMHAGEPIAIGRLLARRSFRAGREREAIRSLQLLAEAAPALAPLHLDVLFARLALDGMAGVAALADVPSLAPLAGALQRCIAAGDLGPILACLAGFETSRDLSVEEHYLAGLAEIASGEPLLGFRHWARMLDPVEFSYRKTNPDIDRAIRAGHVRSGLHHYLNFGQQEGRLFNYVPPHWQPFAAASRDVPEGFAARLAALATMDTDRATDALRRLVRDIIDGGSVLAAAETASLMLEQAEARYLLENAEVGVAIGNGWLVDGADHWLRYGRTEGRRHLVGGIADPSLAGAILAAAMPPEPPGAAVRHDLRTSPLSAWL